MFVVPQRFEMLRGKGTGDADCLGQLGDVGVPGFEQGAEDEAAVRLAERVENSRQSVDINAVNVLFEAAMFAGG